MHTTLFSRRLAALAAVPFVALALGSCDNGGPVDPEPPESFTPHLHNLTEGSPDGLVGTVGEPLASPLTVQVVDLDAGGEPVPGIGVQFSVVGPSGAIEPETATTDVEGIARATWILGTDASHPMQAEATLADTSLAAPMVNQPLAFEADAVAAAPNSIEVVEGDNQKGPPDTEFVRPLTVRVSDAYGNPVDGVEVSWQVGDGGGIVIPSTSTTDSAGLASTRRETPSDVLGSVMTVASVDGLSAAQFVGTVVASSDLVPAEILAHTPAETLRMRVGEVSGPLAALVLDADGYPVEDVWVEFAVIDGGGTVWHDAIETGPEGLAQNQWQFGTEAGAQRLQAVIAGGADTVVFEGVARPDEPARLAAISGSGQSASVGDTLAEPYRARVLDTHGNPVGGIEVRWAVTEGAGSMDRPYSITSSDSADLGVAIAYHVMGDEPGPQAARASLDSVTGAEAQFSATATAGSPASMSPASGEGQIGLPGASLPEPFAVDVVDAGGNPVSDVPVLWSIASGTGDVTEDTVLTDAAGRAAVEWTLGPNAGLDTLTASLEDPDVSLAFTARAAAAELVLHSGDGQSAPVAEPLAEPIQVRLIDSTTARGVPDVAIEFAPAAGQVSTAEALTDSAGNAQATWTLGAATGAQTLVARVPDLGLEVAVSATAVAAPAAALRIVSGSGQQGTVGEPLGQSYEVRVVDAHENPVPAAAVRFDVLSGKGSVAPATVNSDSAGHASTLHTLGGVPGVQEVRASLDADPGVSATFQASAEPAAPVDLLLETGHDQVALPGDTLPEPLVVRARDSFGNPVPDAGIAWVVTPSVGTLVADSATDTSGYAFARYVHGPSSGTVQIEATLASSGARVEFLATAADLVLTLEGGSDQVGEPGETLQEPYRVRTVDSISGRPLSDVPVDWQVLQGEGEIVPVTARTNAQGYAFATRTLGPYVGAHRTRAVAGTDTVVFSSDAVGPNGEAMMNIAAGDNQYGVPGAWLEDSLTVRVLTRAGAPASGVPVQWTVADGDGGSIAVAESQTDADGLAWTRARLPVAQGGTEMRVIARVGALPDSLLFTATTDSAVLEMVGGDGQTGVVGTTLSDPLRVRVTTSAGAPIDGYPVEWAITSGGGVVSSATSASDSTGVAQVTRTLGNDAGTQTTEARVAGFVNSPVIFTHAAVDPQPVPATIVKVSGDDQTFETNHPFGAALVARVLDQSGAPLANVNVAFSVTGGEAFLDSTIDGQFTETLVQLTTDADGEVEVFVRAGSVGETIRITASVPGESAVTPVTFTATKR